MSASLRKPASRSQIADLRAGLRAANAKPRPEMKPPKPRKQAKQESIDERAEKAERQAHAQHTTSLLKGGNSRKPYVRKGERPEKKGGLFFQLILVMIIAVGIAVAIDPSLIPPEWIVRGQELIDSWMPA
jgi:hypothetical protein